MKKRIPREEGFTLIEVLAATVILSVAAMAMMAFFINAMSYNKGNQNKTVMVNLARNALFYMEKQNFSEVEKYFNQIGEADGNDPIMTMDNCTVVSTGGVNCTIPAKNDLLNSFHGIGNVLRPSVNGKEYDITITYQSELEKGQADASTPSTEDRMSKYLIPIRVSVKTLGAIESLRNQTSVEGYVINEKIR